MNIEEAIDCLQNCIADYVIGDFCVGKYCPDEDMCKEKDCPYKEAIDIIVTAYEKEKVGRKVAQDNWGQNVRLVEGLKAELEKEKEKNKELKDINKKLEARKYMLNAITGEVTAIPIDNNYISKDKIKAKIEEIEKDKYISNSDFIEFAEYARDYAKKKVQSLLEKE